MTIHPGQRRVPVAAGFSRGMRIWSGAMTGVSFAMRLDGSAVSARTARLPCPSPEAAPAAARQGGTPHSLDDSRGPAARCGRGDAVARVTARAARLLGGRWPHLVPSSSGRRAAAEEDPSGPGRSKTVHGVRSPTARRAVAILLGVVALAALPTTTEAQTQIWSATLTVGEITNFVAVGCSPCNGTNLSDRTFRYDGVDNSTRSRTGA